MAGATPAISPLIQMAERTAMAEAELHGEAAQLQVLRRQVGDEERPAAALLALEAQVRKGRAIPVEAPQRHQDSLLDHA
eukprot:7596762-Alexandrium_andersonii.AAC.1